MSDKNDMRKLMEAVEPLSEDNEMHDGIKSITNELWVMLEELNRTSIEDNGGNNPYHNKLVRATELAQMLDQYANDLIR